MTICHADTVCHLEIHNLSAFATTTINLRSSAPTALPSTTPRAPRTFPQSNDLCIPIKIKITEQQRDANAYDVAPSSTALPVQLCLHVQRAVVNEAAEPIIMTLASDRHAHCQQNRCRSVPGKVIDDFPAHLCSVISLKIEISVVQLYNEH